MTGRRLIVLASSVLVVLGVLTALLLRFAASPANGNGDVQSAGPVVAADLRKLATDPGALVARDRQGQVDPTAAVPKGTTVEPRESTWRAAGDDEGTMQVRLRPPGGPDVVYVALMVHERNGWKVRLTIPVRS